MEELATSFLPASVSPAGDNPRPTPSDAMTVICTMLGDPKGETDPVLKGTGKCTTRISNSISSPNTDGRNLENEEGKGSNLKFGRSEETSACLLCHQNGGVRAPPREDAKKAETDRLVSAFLRGAC